MKIVFENTREMRDFVRSEIHELAGQGGRMRMYSELSEACGVSASLIAQFANGAKPNPAADTLDKMLDGIRKLREARRAA